MTRRDWPEKDAHIVAWVPAYLVFDTLFASTRTSFAVTPSSVHVRIRRSIPSGSIDNARSLLRGEELPEPPRGSSDDNMQDVELALERTTGRGVFLTGVT